MIRASAIDWPLALVFVLGPVQWVTLVDTGLALKPVHLPVILCALAGFARAGRARGAAARASVAAAGPLALVYVAYLAVLLTGVFPADDPGRGAALVAKLWLQAVLAAGVFLYLLRLPVRRICDSVVAGGLMGAGVFVALAWMTLAAHGQSLPGLVAEALATGSPAPLQFRLFLTLFNAGDWAAGGARTPASLRQVSLGFFCITGLFSAAALVAPARGTAARLAGAAGLGAALLLVLASLSRSLALVLVLSGMLVAAGLVRSRGQAALFAGLVVAAGVGLAWLAGATAGIFELLGARYGDIGADGRLHQYVRTLDSIAAAPLAGYGTGHVEEFRPGARNMVHNLLLGAWVQAGAAGLALALAMTLAALWLLLGRVAVLRRRPDLLALAALPILPLLRSQLGGQGGNYALPELLAFVLGLALLFRPALVSAGRSTRAVSIS